MSVRSICAALPIVLLPLLAGGAAGCGSDDRPPIAAEARASLDASAFPATFARQWMVNVANSVKGDVVSPPVAARTYAYTAIALYESVVHGMPGYQSLAGQLNGLDSLPTPDPSLEYDWPSVMAQTLHRMMLASIPTDGVYTFPNRIFYEYTTVTQAPLMSLGPIQLGYRRAAGVSDPVMDNSIAFANALADVLVPWARADGYYDVRHKGFIPPVGPDKWVPTGFSDTDKVMNPVEPAFGEVRTLVLTSSDECSPANLGLAPPAFSTNPASDFYAAAAFVHDTETNLTDAQRETARFWADGPGDTPTPAGHWVAITTKLVRNLDLGSAAAGYVWVSLGFFDSFIAVWQEKFSSNLLRPETYIRRHIQSDWRPFLPTPPFPTYVSGHSGQSGASAALLTERFGGGPFTDDTKLRRGFAARSFPKLTAAAEEAAASRLYGGIHYAFDNDDGLAVGQCVAAKIIDRVHLQP